MEQSTINTGLLKKVIIISSIILIVGGLAFAKFAIDSQARNMFREAKNVQLAMDMLSIEYYGKEMAIFDADKRNGLADGVAERIENLSGEKGEIFVTGYNAKKREVTGFSYERGMYRVTYRKDKEGTQHWDVDLLINVFKYEKMYEG